ncbi:hypothetical protein ACFLSY_06000 [Bacteroidota bacterium]
MSFIQKLYKSKMQNGVIFFTLISIFISLTSFINVHFYFETTRSEVPKSSDLKNQTSCNYSRIAKSLNKESRYYKNFFISKEKYVLHNYQERVENQLITCCIICNEINCLLNKSLFMHRSEIPDAYTHNFC